MQKNYITKVFLILLLAAVIYLGYLIFEPFLQIILAAIILVSIFYTPYEGLVKIFRGHRQWAALVMCLLVALLVVVPVTNFIVYTAQRSVEAYDHIVTFVYTNDMNSMIKGHPIWQVVDKFGISEESLWSAALDLADKIKSWLVSGTGTLIKGTANFIISLSLIIFTMFFFFSDGPKMLKRLMYLTPLPNKYDREIFKKFRNVSKSIMISSFVTAIAQGLIGAIGFLIVGLPAFFPGIAMAFLSLLPYIGTAVVWLPAGIYLLATGSLWSGLFILIWGATVVGSIDNVIRAYLIKGKAQVHPIFVLFSILGGITLWGFWGVVFGPLVISLAVTILHIYEMEYESILEK